MTVTFTGAKLTSFLLRGGTPTSLAGTERTVLPTSATGYWNFASVPTNQSAAFVSGTEYSSGELATWPGYDALSTGVVLSRSQAPSTSALGVESTVISASIAQDRSTNPSTLVLSTPAIVALAVGTTGLLTIITLILFLLARYKRAKDQERLHNTASDEKTPSNRSTPTRPNGPVTPSNQLSNPFSDCKAPAKPGSKPFNANQRTLQSDVIDSFDFGFVPTKKIIGKDGKPVVVSVLDETDVGRPFTVGRPPSLANLVVAEVSDETPLRFASQSKNLSHSEDSAATGSLVGIPQLKKTISTNSSSACDHLIPTETSTRQVNEQQRQLPISQRISLLDETRSISGKTSSHASVPQPGGMVRSADSNDSATLTSSSIRKARPAPIQVPPPKPDSRGCIVIDKNASLPLTSPPSMPTPPLPSLEFGKDWERLKRDSGDTIDSADTDILDAMNRASESKPNEMTATKGPLQPRSDVLNSPPPTGNESLSKSIPETLLQVACLRQGPLNAGDILKPEKSMLRIKWARSSIAYTSNSSSCSANGTAAKPNINPSPSIVATTAEWAKNRKAPNATLANDHIVLEARATRSNPLPSGAIQKVKEAGKPLQALVSFPVIKDNRDGSVTTKREVEGRKSLRENAKESVGSPTLSVLKCYDPERESPFVSGETLDMIRSLRLDREDKENLAI